MICFQTRLVSAAGWHRMAQRISRCTTTDLQGPNGHVGGNMRERSWLFFPAGFARSRCESYPSSRSSKPVRYDCTRTWHPPTHPPTHPFYPEPKRFGTTGGQTGLDPMAGGVSMRRRLGCVDMAWMTLVDLGGPWPKNQLKKQSSWKQ